MELRAAIDRLRSSFDLYRAAGEEAGQIRAAHIATVLRLTPVVMAGNLLNGVVVALAFRDAPSESMLLWLASLVLLSGLGLRGWLRWRQRPRPSASTRALRHGTWHAAALAITWAAVPLLWFDGATPAQQVLVAIVFTGMMAASAFVLSVLPQAALTYIALMAAAAVLTLVRMDDAAYASMAVLVVCYSVVLAAGALVNERKATALLRAQREATRQRHMLSLLLRDFEEHAVEALWETGRDGRLSHLSPRLSELLGGPAVDLRSLPLLQLLQARSEYGAMALRAAFDEQQAFHDLRLPMAETAGVRWWSLSAKPLTDGEGRVEGWRGVITDVSAEVQAQERLSQMAHFDSLTGLANRLTLHEALHDAMAASSSGALLSIDLDHFKVINDSLGHSTGDAVLQVVAARLSGCVRPGDLVARLGGDEFAVLVGGPCSADEAMALARRMVVALQEPCHTAGRSLRLSASVGLALLGAHGDSADELLRSADLALYAAKQTGRGRAAVYDSVLGERSRRRVALEQGLRQAVEGGQLSLHWQAQVDLRNWRIVGVEALLRWDHPVLGRVQPSEFIAVAEQAGMIHALGGWALREACSTAQQRFPGLSVSVNVSPAQLRDDDFAARVREALRASRLDPSRLELEVTESILLDDVDGAIERLHALRRLGVRIALDDFGTGYSSLAYLRRFPFDALKVDRAFVSELLLRPDAQAIVRMITQLSRTLGMRTIAEGVETEAQLGALADAACHEAQGYLISRPCDTAEFVRLRSGWTGRPPAAPVLH